MTANRGDRRPILVTGMPRSGTTWVARMLCASGRAGYINEPFNLATSPGTFRVPVDNWYPYVTEESERQVLPELSRALEFRYPLGRELRSCRTRIDLLHTLKMWQSFVRSRGRRPLVKEPHAVFAAEWFARRLGSIVVVTVRHPAAVVSSWKRLEWSFDFEHLLRQQALVRERLRSFEGEMEAALAPSNDLVDRVALLWRVIYHTVAELKERFPEFEPEGDARREAIRDEARQPRQPRELRGRLTAGELLRVKRVTRETASIYYPEDGW
jgi:hypothetical protein